MVYTLVFVIYISPAFFTYVSYTVKRDVSMKENFDAYLLLKKSFSLISIKVYLKELKF